VISRDVASLMKQLVSDRHTWGEIVRFVLVGVKSNILYVVIYVGLTFLGVDHRIALTVVYGFGILYMFVFNKYYVFRVSRCTLRSGWLWSFSSENISFHFGYNRNIAKGLTSSD
jgi:putative flippase GtrA